MHYPYLLFDNEIKTRPLLKELRGRPILLDLETAAGPMGKLAPRDQRGLQASIEQLMGEETNWGLSGYLEDRRILLADCPQMISEERYYHLGLDIITAPGTRLHAPLSARVAESGYEEGTGNYGAFVLLEHAILGHETFYSLYGHLARSSLPAVSTLLSAGDSFAAIGDYHENGDWFYHTHLQILTPLGLEKGFLSKGYCTAANLAEIPKLCPDPLPFLSV